MTGGPTYSQRQPAGGDGPEPLSRRFLPAFQVFLDRFAAGNYFCEAFAAECCDGHPIGWRTDRVAAALTEAFGPFSWPRPGDAPAPDDATVLDLVEFFFQHVSKPTDGWYHSFSGCEGYHPTAYDRGRGRYDYTVGVNALFRRFQQPYDLLRGKVQRRGSAVLDSAARSAELPTDDPHLRRLLSSAEACFFDGENDRRLDGLRHIVDAFERLKSASDPTNKRRSAEALIRAVAAHETLVPHWDGLFRALTDVANRNTIRHHEHGTAVLDDALTVEYLFYAYYNLVRFLLLSQSGRQ